MGDLKTNVKKGFQMKPSKGKILNSLPGVLSELKQHYYYFSIFQQADRYITTTKAIVDHVGR